MRRRAPFAAGLAAYAALLLASIWLLSLDRFEDGPIRGVIVLLPLPAAVAIVVIAARQYRALDELAQRIALHALAVAFLGTLLIAFSWGFVEGVGIARPSGFVIFAIQILLYLAGLTWARRQYR